MTNTESLIQALEAVSFCPPQSTAVVRLEKAIEIVRAHSGCGMPIESAPKDGTHILGYLPYGKGSILETWWHIDERKGVWFHNDGEACPTYFMLLPTPPSEGEK